MVIRNYHWLNSASRVLISTCSAPLLQTGERNQLSLFDLDLYPTTLTYNPRLAKVKVDPHVKNQGQKSNGSNRRAPTDKRTDTHTDATKRIIAPATRSIINISGMGVNHGGTRPPRIWSGGTLIQIVPPQISSFIKRSQSRKTNITFR